MADSLWTTIKKAVGSEPEKKAREMVDAPPPVDGSKGLRRLDDESDGDFIVRKRGLRKEYIAARQKYENEGPSQIPKEESSDLRSDVEKAANKTEGALRAMGQ